jgi:hypothetical protein
LYGMAWLVYVKKGDKKLACDVFNEEKGKLALVRRGLCTMDGLGRSLCFLLEWFDFSIHHIWMALHYGILCSILIFIFLESIKHAVFGKFGAREKVAAFMVCSSHTYYFIFVLLLQEYALCNMDLIGLCQSMMPGFHYGNLTKTSCFMRSLWELERLRWLQSLLDKQDCPSPGRRRSTSEIHVLKPR